VSVLPLRVHAFAAAFGRGHAARRAFFRLLLGIALAALCACNRRQNANQVVGSGAASANNDGRRGFV